MSTALELLKADKANLANVIALNCGKDVDAITIAETEIMHLNILALTKPDIAQCEPITIVAAMRRTMKQNLSLDPDLGLVYVKTRNVKTVDGQWAKHLEVMPTANGLISIARQCGRILDIKRPDVEYENNKVVRVRLEYLVPSVPNPRWTDIDFDENDFMRWRKASHKENSRGKNDANERDYSNPNYTSHNGGIDPEFARAKAIRHGLKKLGTNQNEIRMTRITVPVEKIVDEAVDAEVINDENIELV